MAITDPKDDLQRYLQVARDAVVWKLDGLAEYDVRRPLTADRHQPARPGQAPGLGRGRLPRRRRSAARSREPDPCDDPDADPTADMWATAEESREDIVGALPAGVGAQRRHDRRAAARRRGPVPWWPAERRHGHLHRILVHVIAETNRHAGHADIVRELIDGAAGLRADNDNLPPGMSWPAHRDRVETAARDAAARAE